MNGEVGDHGQTPAGVIPLLKQETPEIEAATRYTYFRGNSPFTMSDNKHRLKATFILADSSTYCPAPCSSETLSKFSPNPCTCSYPTRSPNVSAVT